MIYYLNDHKTGFVLSQKIINSLPIQSSMRTFFHFWKDIDESKKHIIFIRHPYEVITSGYKYHKICHESWAVNDENMFWWWAKNHFTEKSVKENQDVIEFANFSKEINYKDRLNSMSIEDGLEYEMRHVGYMTVMGMYKWPHYNNKNVFIARMEDLFENYELTMKKMLEFIGIPDFNFSSFNIKNMSDSEIKENSHITNKEKVKYAYEKMWTEKLYKIAKEIFPADLFEKLGY